MTSRATVVVGAQYGDEGKGLATDYFCAAAKRDAVAVRFSGGAQAGHTVVTPAGRRHVFHHLGAGTLAGAATFLSHFFVVNPLLWADERSVLPDARVFVDPDAPVTTPYDMLVNQEVEAWRGAARHGSCGLGINETIERDRRGTHGLRVRHLADAARLAATLDAIRREYVPSRLRDLGCTPSDWFLDMVASSVLRESFLRLAAAFLAAVEIRDLDCLRRFGTVVFEGSQGLGLDERYGVFPHVTRGRTGAGQAVALAAAAGMANLEVVYVSRAYVTRHGAGPFPTEDSALSYRDDTNVANPHQGPLRFGHLDVDGTLAMIARDVRNTRPLMAAGFPVSMLVTCMDQVAAGGRYRADGTWNCDIERLPLHVAEARRFHAVYRSTGPTRRHVAVVRSSGGMAGRRPTRHQDGGNAIRGVGPR